MTDGCSILSQIAYVMLRFMSCYLPIKDDDIMTPNFPGGLLKFELVTDVQPKASTTTL